MVWLTLGFILALLAALFICFIYFGEW